jgi:pimeloyl-ACP methyl ester carboxylesterase
MKVAVVFVHGLFLNGAEFGLLRRRLAAAHGFECHRFSYPTVRGSMERAVDQLAGFVDRIDAESIHFVGHSLGGVVLCRYFQNLPGSQQRCARPGRVVLLGAPLTGSATARAVARRAWLRPVIGPLAASEFVEECAPRQWSCGRELGLIAGTRPLGLGRFFARFDEDCDGTVAVSETKLPGHTAHVTLPVSHMGMLVSAEVAREAGEFLAHGRFSYRELP